MNLLKQLGKPGLVARKVEINIPNFEGLYLPPVMEELCKYDQGMVLLAGVTGSGKSTTIASMLELDQPPRAGPHPDDRGPDRIRATGQDKASSTSAKSGWTSATSTSR